MSAMRGRQRWLIAAVVMVMTLVAARGAQAQTTSIVVNANHPGAAISGSLFGADLLAPDAGMGSFDTTTDSFYPSLLQDLSTSAYVGSIRFPGGITAETYDWQRAIPQGGRMPNPIGPGYAATDSSVGPDEFGQLLDQTGATGIITTNFGTGTAAEAADWVQYMTGTDTSNPYVQDRIANGHPAPYNVPYWEVGNEESAAAYWRTGTNLTSEAPAGATCPTVSACAYVFGGSSVFTQQDVVGYANRQQPSASTASTAANQSFYVQYPPVDTSGASTPAGRTPEVYVVPPNSGTNPGAPWTEVTAAQLASAGPTAEDYTLNATTGQITFGNGTNGAIPTSGDTIEATYTSGPHDGFNAFYSAMKAANPNIKVCSTATAENFIEVMGSTYPYDCMQYHPYVGGTDASTTEPITDYENDVMNAPATEASAAQTLSSEMQSATGHAVPLVLTEYGQLIDATPDPATEPYYLNSLDEALVNASQLANWISLGVPVADRQLLTAELPAAADVTDGLPGAAPDAVTGAITTTAGPTTVVQPTAEYVRLMASLAGEQLLGSSTTSNPGLATTTGAAVGAVSTVAGAGGGNIDVVAINRSPTSDVPAAIDIQGFHGHGAAQVTTLNGPSVLSDNTAAAPSTVTTSSTTAPVSKGQAHLTLPAHSVSLIQIAGL